MEQKMEQKLKTALLSWHRDGMQASRHACTTHWGSDTHHSWTPALSLNIEYAAFP